MKTIFWEIETDGLSTTSKITKLIVNEKEVSLNLIHFVDLLFKADRNVTHYGLGFDIPVLVHNVRPLLSSEKLSKLIKHLMKTSYDITTREKQKWVTLKKKDNETNNQFDLRVMKNKAKGSKFSMDYLTDKYNVSKEKSISSYI